MTRIAGLLEALGGVENIMEIEPCTTRLRCVVADPALIDSQALRSLGAHGVLVNGFVVQVIMGPEVDTIATDLTEMMWAITDGGEQSVPGGSA